MKRQRNSCFRMYKELRRKNNSTLLPFVLFLFLFSSSLRRREKIIITNVQESSRDRNFAARIFYAPEKTRTRFAPTDARPEKEICARTTARSISVLCKFIILQFRSRRIDRGARLIVETDFDREITLRLWEDDGKLS